MSVDLHAHYHPRAYQVARDVFGLPSFWRAVAQLDHQVDTATQIAMRLEARRRSATQ